jgi:hypothetical protein
LKNVPVFLVPESENYPRRANSGGGHCLRYVGSGNDACTYRHANRYRDAYTNRYCDANVNRYCDLDCNSLSHADGDRYRDASARERLSGADELSSADLQ